MKDNTTPENQKKSGLKINHAFWNFETDMHQIIKDLFINVEVSLRFGYIIAVILHLLVDEPGISGSTVDLSHENN